jgi:hypothetical protein
MYEYGVQIDLLKYVDQVKLTSLEQAAKRGFYIVVVVEYELLIYMG